MIEIALLVDVPEVIPTLSDWFLAQWSAYYARRTPAEIAQDFVAEANDGRLPTRLVAFVDGTLAGTICLRERATRELPDYRPGLGGLLVAAQFRGHGIGTELVRAGMQVAQAQGYDEIYATTLAAGGILARLGWQPLQGVSIGEEDQILYRCDLAR